MHPQGAADVARGDAVSRGRAARPDRRDPGAGLPRRRRRRRALRARRPRPRSPAASSASARSCSSISARSPAPPRARPTPPRSCPSPTAISTSSTASWSTSPARFTTRATPRCWARLLGDEALAPPGAARRAPAAATTAYLGGLLEHTVAVGTLALEACQLHPRLNTDLLITAALVHDLGKTEEFTFGAEIGISEPGRLLGHVELGLRLLDERITRIPALDADRRLALGHCVLTHHGPDAAPAALRLARGARALPPQRARREREGRAGARAGPRRLGA